MTLYSNLVQINATLLYKEHHIKNINLINYKQTTVKSDTYQKKIHAFETV